MGSKQKLLKSEADAEVRRIIETYPRKEVRIEARSHTRDMSVGISNKESYVVPFDEIKKGELLYPDFTFVVTDVTEDCLTLYWKCWEQEYVVKLGETVKTRSEPFGTQYCPGELYYEFKFQYVTLWDKALDIITEVSNYHARFDQIPSQVPQTTRNEIIGLQLLDRLIDEGNVGLYSLKALLAASNDWSTGIIVRPSFFRHILLEGIDKGCLAPDDAEGWKWIKIAADNNDPEMFMDDMDRWYDILATAVENGNEIARDIMNRIWEPEQIIEED